MHVSIGTQRFFGLKSNSNDGNVQLTKSFFFALPSVELLSPWMISTCAISLLLVFFFDIENVMVWHSFWWSCCCHCLARGHDNFKTCQIVVIFALWTQTAPNIASILTRATMREREAEKNNNREIKQILKLEKMEYISCHWVGWLLFFLFCRLSSGTYTWTHSQVCVDCSRDTGNCKESNERAIRELALNEFDDYVRTPVRGVFTIITRLNSNWAKTQYHNN